MNLQVTLAALEHAALIRRLREGDGACQFKHNLIQESAYSSLLKNDRRALHRACAEAVERAYPDALDEYATLLAKHFAEAGDDAKTFYYARRAGDAAFRIHALAEALMHYDTAGVLAARLQISIDDVLHLHQQRGRVLEVMGRYEEAVAAYRALEQLGKTRNEPQLELGALLSLATLFTFPNPAQNLDQALRANQAALNLAREIHDEPSEARALWNMQQHAYFMGRAFDSVSYSQQALAITDRLDLRELRAYILNDVSRSLVTTQSVPDALNALAEAREIFRAANNLPMLVDNLSTTAEIAQVSGEFELAISFAHQSQELSRMIGNIWNLAYSNTSLLTIHAERGEYIKTIETCAETVQLATQSGFLLAAAIADTQRALVYGVLGDTARALELLQLPPQYEQFGMMQAWFNGSRIGIHLLDGNLEAARQALAAAQAGVRADDLSTYGPIFVALGAAELALQEKRYADALAAAKPLADRMRALHFHFFFPQILLRQARAYLGLREYDAAVTILTEAENIARYEQARPVLFEILAARSELETQRGNPERAHTLKQQAREIVEWLTAHTPTEMRASFLAQDKVRAVMTA